MSACVDADDVAEVNCHTHMHMLYFYVLQLYNFFRALSNKNIIKCALSDDKVFFLGILYFLQTQPISVESGSSVLEKVWIMGVHGS